MKKIMIFLIFFGSLQVLKGQKSFGEKYYQYRDSRILLEIRYPKVSIKQPDSFEIVIKIKNLSDSTIAIYSPEHMRCYLEKEELRIKMGFDILPSAFPYIGIIKLEPKSEELIKLFLKQAALKIYGNHHIRVLLDFFYSSYLEDCKEFRRIGIDKINEKKKLDSIEIEERSKLYQFYSVHPNNILYYDDIPYLPLDGQLIGMDLPSFSM